MQFVTPFKDATKKVFVVCECGYPNEINKFRTIKKEGTYDVIECDFCGEKLFFELDDTEKYKGDKKEVKKYINHPEEMDNVKGLM